MTRVYVVSTELLINNALVTKGEIRISDFNQLTDILETQCAALIQSAKTSYRVGTNAPIFRLKIEAQEWHS